MKGKVTKLLLAALTGAMLMAAPVTVMAENAYHPTESVDAAVPAVQNLRIMYQNSIPCITWDNVLNSEGQTQSRIYVEWSETDQFLDNSTTNYESTSGTMFIPYDVEPGKTYYVRAFIRQTVYAEYDEEDDYYWDGTSKYGPMSNVITYTTEVPEVTIGASSVTSNSVSFSFGPNGYTDGNYKDYVYSRSYKYDYNGDGVVDANDSYEYTSEDTDFVSSFYEKVTGFEIYRAAGTGKYTKIATVADTSYTDKNLKSDTNYRYKIRAYVMNAAGEKIYGKFTYVRKTTWGRNLELKATVKGSSSVKLSWKKVTGASGYRIYRYVGNSNTGTIEKGMTTNFSNYQLVKTIKKAKTTSWTDKKLKANETYGYKVVAYKNVKGTKKVMNIEDAVSVTLGFDDNFYFTNSYTTADGSVVASWNKLVGAEGYVIQKKDAKTGAWTTTANLGADAVTATFSAAAEEKTSSYRIYAYVENNISSYEYVYPEYVKTVARSSGIMAAANADLSGVTVSWAPVEGAAYYKVYRSRQLGNYNADKAFYNIPNGVTVQILKTAGKLSADGTYYETYPEYTDKITATSVLDVYQGYQYKESKWDEATQKDVETIETRDVQKAPAMGVRYYYYVQAFAMDGTPVVSDITDEIWDETAGDWKDTVVGTRTTTTYRGGLSGKPASVVLDNVSLKAPKISKVTSAKKGKAVVKWNKVTGASKYYVYYSTKKSSGYTFAGITTKTNLTVSGLNSGKKYYFKVKAQTANAAGADVFSGLSAAKNKKVK